MAERAAANMLDIAFAVELEPTDPAAGTTEMLLRDHRRLLADALLRALPWLASEPGAGVHRLNLSAGGGAMALMSRRTRLMLRVPRARAAEAEALARATLVLGAQRLRLGAAQRRELLPFGTLYAHLVADEAGEQGDEAAFLRRIEDELAARGVPCRVICGRHQSLEDGQLTGYSLMLDGLSPPAALRMLQSGLGAHRSLGCGLFVPHKSAAAVGMTN